MRDDEVYLLWTPIAPPVDEATRARWESVCTAEELARIARYHFLHHRDEHLATRALARRALSAFCDVPPEAWRFVDNTHGRPEIAGPDGAPPLRFNCANTDGLVACVVSLARDVGVDVEALDRRSDGLAVAERFFSASESAALRALPAARQRDRFFRYWTLKESYIKARGMGLAIPLEKFSFVLDEDSPAIGFSTDPSLGDDAAPWRFAELRPTARHRVAVAARGEHRLLVEEFAL